MFDCKKVFGKLVIKNIAQKVMTKSGFGHKFHDLKYFKINIFHIP
jgi:hypothetical protein